MSAARAHTLEVEVEEVRVWEVPPVLVGAPSRRASRVWVCVGVCVLVSLVGEVEVAALWMHCGHFQGASVSRSG